MFNSLLINEDKMILAAFQFHADRYYYSNLRLKNVCIRIVNFGIACQEAAKTFNVFNESISC